MQEKEVKVGDKVMTPDGEVEVTAVNDDGSCECKCCKTGERKVLMKEQLGVK